MADQMFSPVRRAETQQPTIYGLIITFTILSCTCVILRLYTRTKILHNLGADDIAILIAQILSFGVAISSCLQVTLGGLGLHIEFVPREAFLKGAKALYSNLLVYNAAQIATKLSFLIQYHRLFPMRSIQIICKVGMVFLGVWGVVQQFITGFSCIPLEALVPSWRGRCIPTFPIWNVNSIMNILTDFLIFLIPIYPVSKLQLSLRRKTHLLFLFCLGFFACIISILRLTDLYRTQHATDVTWSSSATAYWSSIELNIGILCACLPVIRPLLKQLAPCVFGTSQHSGGGVSSSSYKLQTITSGGAGPRTADVEEGSGGNVYIGNDVEFRSTTELQSSPTMFHQDVIVGDKDSLKEVGMRGV